MNTILKKLIKGEKTYDYDIEEALFQICEDEHSTCNDRCPVYEQNKFQPVGADKPFTENRGCDCFKNGKAMLAFLRGGERGECKKCGSQLKRNGLCNDQTCPYSERKQDETYTEG